jgi:hypothetical protein
MIMILKKILIARAQGGCRASEKRKENKPPDLCTHLNWNIKTVGSNPV